MLKRIVAASLVLCMGISMGISTYAMENPCTESEQLVEEFWNSINLESLDVWSSYFTPRLKDHYQNLVQNKTNQENHIGILNVKNVEITEITKIDDSYAPRYPELEELMQSPDNYDCYRVVSEMTTYQDSDYFSTGVDYSLVLAVKDNGEWGIGGVANCPEYLKNDSHMHRAVLGYGFVSYVNEPATIDVMDERGVIHRNVDFTDFIVNVTCNEIGNMGYDVEAIKANAMAVKMCGWWAVAGEFLKADGCDIKYGSVAYKSSLATTTANTRIVENAVNEIDGYEALGSNGKLFFMNYYAGQYDSAGKNSGYLRQNGSSYLADQGYDWKEILHYYYDNSSTNNPGTGIIKIQ